MKTLRATLAYQNHELILRIQKALRTNRSESWRVFSDVKAWLWLCARHRYVRHQRDTQSCGHRLPYLAMIEHFVVIDLGWHEFILMTKAYRDFCEEYLDGYIHHLPGLIDSTTLQRKKRAQTKVYMTRYLSFMEDEIGPRRLTRWLKYLPKVQDLEQHLL